MVFMIFVSLFRLLLIVQTLSNPFVLLVSGATSSSAPSFLGQKRPADGMSPSEQEQREDEEARRMNHEDKKAKVVAPKILTYDPTTAPKLELHVHLDGAFDARYLFALAQKHVDKLPTDTVVTVPGPEPDGSTDKKIALPDFVNGCDFLNDFLAAIVVPNRGKCNTLANFLQPFYWTGAIVQTAVAEEGLGVLEEFARLFVKRQKESNVLYTEVRYNPHLFSKESAVFDPNPTEAVIEKRYHAAKKVVEAVSRGLRRGEEEFRGHKVNQLLCCLDFLPAVTRKWSVDIPRLLAEVGHTCGCVGIDVASGESHFSEPPETNLQLAAVNQARKAGFRVALHAGEDENTGGSALNVQKAVEIYGADRIGHGYCALQSGKVCAIAKKAGAHFETCETSSLLTGGFKWGDEEEVVRCSPCFSSSGYTGADQDPIVSADGIPDIPVDNGAPTYSGYLLSEMDTPTGGDIPWPSHPLRKFYDAGLRCSVNTDDPLMEDTTLNKECALALNKIGMTPAQMREMTLWQIDDAFIDHEKEKDDLRERVEEYWSTVGE